MFVVPEEYVVQKFFQYCGAPKHNKYNQTYEGSCPICREGKSWLKKRRCFFIPKNNNIYCHNCGWSSVPITWILEVSQSSFTEIRQEIEEGDFYIEDIDERQEHTKIYVPDLPLDIINLSNPSQIEFYKEEPTVQLALSFIKQRRLDTAAYAPTLYTSLDDVIHKDRLIIPFIGDNNCVLHYQSREIPGIGNREYPRYLSKQGSEKTLFNFSKIDPEFSSIFIFEGPLNACFVKNGVAVAGIQENSHRHFSNRQLTQLKSLPLVDKIWVLDSQWIDKAALNKSKIIASQGEKIFIWPEKLGKYFKDFNDLAIHTKLDEISSKFILDNTHQGIVAEIKLRSI